MYLLLPTHEETQMVFWLKQKGFYAEIILHCQTLVQVSRNLRYNHGPNIEKSDKGNDCWHPEKCPGCWASPSGYREATAFYLYCCAMRLSLRLLLKQTIMSETYILSDLTVKLLKQIIMRRIHCKIWQSCQ